MARRRGNAGDEQARAEERKRIELEHAQTLEDLRLLIVDARFQRFFERLTTEFDPFSSECFEEPVRQYFRDGQKSVVNWLLRLVKEAQTPAPAQEKPAREENDDGE